VGAKEKMSSIGQPVPELPVVDVERAQQHYRDALGFEIGWLYPGKEIGAVSRGTQRRMACGRSRQAVGLKASAIDNPALIEASFPCCVGRIGADRKGNAHLR
jgi:hypothetical protein